MTAPAIRKRQVTAERSLAVMAGQTALAAACKVLGSAWQTELPALRRSRDQRVTAGALQALARSVFRVGEADAERACTS